MKEKKFFLAFDIHSDLQKSFDRIGFLETDQKIGSNNVFYYDNSQWIEVDSIDYYQGFIIFGRLPQLDFVECWNLVVNKKDDNKIGALNSIVNNYSLELKNYLRCIVEEGNIDKKTKKELQFIKKNVIPYYAETIERMKVYSGCTWEEINYFLCKIGLR